MLPKKYNTQETETKWHQKWEQDKVYKWESEQPRDNTFVIDTPPPTVSGLLHMGHIFSYTQTDFIARYQRMSGKTVFYPMGFDDNGLPTERLVEKVKGVRAGNMEREEFIKLCEDVVEEAEEEFRKLFKSVALSVDWDEEYQTVSKQSRKISQLSFMDLYKNDHIYRTNAPTFWDPVDRTAIAQAEIEDKERQGVMNDVVFKAEDGSDITIGTTRPEMIPACVAMFFHPDDERYKHLEGKKAITPIFEAEVPIMADEDVDPEKGTGIVMSCTFGDIQDIDWWRRHNLPIKEIITLDGKMQHSGDYDGMKVKACREKIIEDLKANGQLTKQVETTQFVKCAERSGAPLEIIPTHQWYVKLLDKKAKLLEKAAECTWYPPYMKIRLDNWINGLNQDWCISRQRYFGVPFPIWYSRREGEEGKVLIASPDQLPVDPLVDLPEGYSRDEVDPETDVMDTWATSSCSPQLNSLAISDEFGIDNERHKKLFPMDLRPQAHEIIRTWAFYTIVKAYYHENTIPWKNLMISGWCLAEDKTKMSKSKGNVVTPRALIENEGADVVRFWASNSKLGTDIAYSPEIFKIGKKLLNKIWNASKFAALQLENLEGTPSTPAEDIKSGTIFESLDLWILSRLKVAIDKATEEFEQFEYSDARSAVEDFFWNDFCDNYLELVKSRAYNPEGDNDKGQQSAAYTIHHCLKNILLLFAPIMPHVTEELNEGIFGGESVHKRGSWPNANEHYYDESKESEGIHALNVLELVRKLKSVNNVSLKAELESVEFEGCELSDSTLSDIKNASNAKDVKIGSGLKGDGAMTSEDGKYKVKVVFAEEAAA